MTLFWGRMRPGLCTSIPTPHFQDVEAKVPTLEERQQEWQPGPRAAGKHSFITDLPDLLLSLQKAQLLGTVGFMGSFANWYGQVKT